VVVEIEVVIEVEVVVVVVVEVYPGGSFLQDVQVSP
jgi:hypothetical protein